MTRNGHLVWSHYFLNDFSIYNIFVNVIEAEEEALDIVEASDESIEAADVFLKSI